MSDKTQKRKRTVRNAIVDIDSVSVQPGMNYSNWAKLSKQQLKERELTLLKLKINKIQSIVNNECKVHNFAIKQDIIDATINTLGNKIDAWNGVNINRTKSSLYIYANYFNIGKKWWDNQKRSIYGDIFWLQVFQFTQQFVKDDLQLLLKIINICFYSKFECPNTKPCPLISTSTLIYSNQIHKYLYNKHHSLNITQWLDDNEYSTQKAKIIIQKLRNTLGEIISNQIIENDRCVNYNPPNIAQVTNTNINYNSNNSIFINNISVNDNFNHNITLNNPMVLSYGGLHHADMYTVLDERYTPLLSIVVNKNGQTKEPVYYEYISKPSHT
eukprot:375730_1